MTHSANLEKKLDGCKRKIFGGSTWTNEECSIGGGKTTDDFEGYKKNIQNGHSFLCGGNSSAFVCV